MDVEKLLRRMNHNEDVIRLLISEREEKVLYLKNPKTLAESRKRRKYFEYYDHIVENEPYTLDKIKEDDHSANQKDIDFF